MRRYSSKKKQKKAKNSSLYLHIKHVVILLSTTALVCTLGTYLISKDSMHPQTLTQKVIPIAKGDEETYRESEQPSEDNKSNTGTPNPYVILHGPRDKKQVALTFDAEMTGAMKENVLSGKAKSSYDSRIIDTLVKTNTQATLFLTGMWIELYPQVTKNLAANPLFEFGSHSYADTSYNGYCYGLPQLSPLLRIEDIGATEKLLREYTGRDNHLFRFPGGCYSASDVQLVRDTGDTIVHWDVVGDDGFNDNAQSIVDNVVSHVKNGSIIILHLNGEPTAPKTAEALPEIIQKLKSEGYEFVKVSQLLSLPLE